MPGVVPCGQVVVVVVGGSSSTASFTSASTMPPTVSWSPEVAQPPVASAALHVRLNLASAAERQSRSGVPVVAALAWHLVFEAVLLPAARIFMLAHRLASSVPRIVPGGAPASAGPAPRLTGCTFVSIVP